MCDEVSTNLSYIMIRVYCTRIDVQVCVAENHLKKTGALEEKSFLREAIYSGESFDWRGNVLLSARRADKETHYRYPHRVLKLRRGSVVLRDIKGA